MPATTARPTRKRYTRIDEAKVTELHQRGVQQHDIAKHQGVSNSTISKFIERTKQEQELVDYYKANRADILAGLQTSSVDLQKKIIASFSADGVIDSLSASQKSGLLTSLNIVAGTSFDKERLERGQSTTNISVYSRMLDDTVKQVYTPQPVVSATTDPAPIDVTPHQTSES